MTKRIPDVHPEDKSPPAGRRPRGGVLIDGAGHAFSFTPFGDGEGGAAGGVVGFLKFVGTTEGTNGDGAQLTPRETQVAWLLASRATNAEIAAALGRSAHTARNHTRRVLEKLGLKSKADVRSVLTNNRGKGNKDARNGSFAVRPESRVLLPITNQKCNHQCSRGEFK